MSGVRHPFTDMDLEKISRIPLLIMIGHGKTFDIFSEGDSLKNFRYCFLLVRGLEKIFDIVA